VLHPIHCQTPLPFRDTIIGRELKCTTGAVIYDANAAHLQSQARRFAVRRVAKLHVDSVLLKVVQHQFSLLWSPQQTARKLRSLWPNNPEKLVSHETIYNAIYMHPRGELKRELMPACATTIKCANHAVTATTGATRFPTWKASISGLERSKISSSRVTGKAT